MTSIPRRDVRVLGSLGEADGFGVVRMEDRFEAALQDVWSALTERERLARWYGEVEGELRVGGDLRVRVHVSGWEGTCQVKACEAPRRLLILSQERDEPNEDSTEVLLSRDDGETVVVVEQRGLPLDLLWAYAAGLQIHVEDLGANISGEQRPDTAARFAALRPVYQDLAANLSE